MGGSCIRSGFSVFRIYKIFEGKDLNCNLQRHCVGGGRGGDKTTVYYLIKLKLFYPNYVEHAIVGNTYILKCLYCMNTFGARYTKLLRYKFVYYLWFTMSQLKESKRVEHPSALPCKIFSTGETCSSSRYQSQALDGCAVPSRL